MRNLFVVLLLTISYQTYAQELNANVVVNHAQVQGSDDEIYDNMEKAMVEFLNARKWTTDVFKVEERIECSFFITISSRDGNNFSGSIQVQSSRPVYGTNYKSNMFLVNDNDFNINYVDQQALDFNAQEFTSNLTSILAFYAYTVVGLDYDSFGREAGEPYFKKAFEIMNNAQSSGGTGWKSSDGTQNRYWLIENLNNGAFKAFRETLYMYHIQGMDIMKDKKAQATTAILKALQNLEKVHKRKPFSYLMQVFFNGKVDEIVDIFKSATPQQKTMAVELLILIDPGNTKKYNLILKE